MEAKIKKTINKEDIAKIEKYRWVVWSILAAIYFIGFFHRMGVGVVKSDLQQTFSIGAAQFATLGSMYFYASFIMQIPSGILADTIGSKKTVIIGALVSAIGSIVFGMAPNITIAYIGRIIVGLGVSVVFIAILKIQTNWFYTKDFAAMSGLTSFVGNMGGVLAQTPLVLMVGYMGWRMSFMTMGAVSFVFTVLCIIFVKNSPSEMGLPSLAEIENRPAGSNTKIQVLPSLKAVISNPKTWLPCIVIFGLMGSYVLLNGTFGASYLVEAYKISKIQASNYLSIVLVGVAVGSVIVGKVSDSIKKRKLPMLVLTGLNLLCWIVLIYIPMSASLLYVFFAVFGMSYTGLVLCWSVGKEVNDPKIAGISTSVVNCVGMLGSAVLPMIFGAYVDKYKDLTAIAAYNKAFVVVIFVTALSFLATLVITETRAQNVYKKLKIKE